MGGGLCRPLTPFLTILSSFEKQSVIFLNVCSYATVRFLRGLKDSTIREGIHYVSAKLLRGYKKLGYRQMAAY